MLCLGFVAFAEHFLKLVEDDDGVHLNSVFQETGGGEILPQVKAVVVIGVFQFSVAFFCQPAVLQFVDDGLGVGGLFRHLREAYIEWKVVLSAQDGDNTSPQQGGLSDARTAIKGDEEVVVDEAYHIDDFFVAPAEQAVVAVFFGFFIGNQPKPRVFCGHGIAF